LALSYYYTLLQLSGILNLNGTEDNAMKRLMNIFFISLIINAITFSSSWADGTPVMQKAVRGDELMDIARNEGTARIIVKLDVPDIQTLTTASNAYRMKKSEKQDVQEALKADAKLSAEISSIADSVISQLQDMGLPFEINHTYSTLPLIAMNVSEETLKMLDTITEVVNITKDKLSFPLLDNTVNIIGASNSWGGGYTGEGWYVAILDTGIRPTHEFFDGKTIIEACYASGSDGNPNDQFGDCPNGLNQMTGSGSAAHYPNSYLGYDHGTHVAGIAAGNNGSLSGVAKDADIIAVQVFSRFSGFYCGGGDCVASWDSDQIAGLEYVYNLSNTYNIASVNMSLGGGGYSSACDNEPIKIMIDNLRDVGIATIVASGNDGYCGAISYPACISSAIAVGASTDGDTETSFNNWSETLMDLFAPGANIYSSTGASDSSYESWNGTSMATPHVAGAFALLKQKSPTLSVTDLLSALTSTGASITTLCFPQTSSKPRIQVDAALNSILLPDPIEGTGYEVIIDFGAGSGIWVWYNDTRWEQLHKLSPEIITAGDIDGSGQDEVIVDFGPESGIQVWYNDTSWEELHYLSPEIITTGDIDGSGQDDVIIDFGSDVGIWVWSNDTSWEQRHYLSPEIITTGDLDGSGQDDVIIDFGSGVGIWVWYNDRSWKKLHYLSPEIITTGDIDGSGQDDVIIDFGSGGGIWVWSNDTSWEQLHNSSPKTITLGDIDGSGQDDVIIDFGSGVGIWVWYNDTSWEELHYLSPKIQATGNIDGN
jgi:subtilisin family serine protease